MSAGEYLTYLLAPVASSMFSAFLVFTPWNFTGRWMPCPSGNLKMLARSCGWRASHRRTVDCLGDELRRAREQREPTLLLLDDSIFD